MKLNILIAYPYFTDTMIKTLESLDHSKYRLIVDSGCFTAYNTGKIITLDGYMNFLKRIESLKPFKAVQLDVFGNPDETLQNYKKMLENGFSDIMPVFTRGDSLDKLEYFYSKTNYIMFGGIVVGGKNKEYIKWFLQQNKNRDCHWLGFVKPQWIRVYKPYSCDSSSWSGTSRFGHLDILRENQEFFTVNKSHFSKKPKKEIIECLFKLGLTIDEIKKLGKKEAWRGVSSDYNGVKGFAQLVNTLSHIKRMYDIRKKYGTRVFLACGSDLYLEMLLNGDKFLKERGVI